MLDWLDQWRHYAAAIVGKRAFIIAGQTAVTGVELQMMEFRVQRHLRVVVINFSRTNRAILNCQIKERVRPSAVRTGLRRRGQVRAPSRVNSQAHHRLIKNDGAQFQVAVKKREKLKDKLEMFRLEKRRSRRRRIVRAANHDVSKIECQTGPMYRQTADFQTDAGAPGGLNDNLRPQEISKPLSIDYDDQ